MRIRLASSTLRNPGVRITPYERALVDAIPTQARFRDRWVFKAHLSGIARDLPVEFDPNNSRLRLPYPVLQRAFPDAVVSADSGRIVIPCSGTDIFSLQLKTGKVISVTGSQLVERHDDEHCELIPVE